ncbi:hypothetical protein EW146_g7075 [Bondarzewia mesenterica]|uniref:Uncharacterized protein n=1 Tax=Bondarzewia mesenterica TaxID=1095465 RepID=A0A4S4LSH9_9AGAM|nr:hypothetical protein EW146_g7075 [Bondarzewia mesenterica]
MVTILFVRNRTILYMQPVMLGDDLYLPMDVFKGSLRALAATVALLLSSLVLVTTPSVAGQSIRRRPPSRSLFPNDFKRFLLHFRSVALALCQSNLLPGNYAIGNGDNRDTVHTLSESSDSASNLRQLLNGPLLPRGIPSDTGSALAIYTGDVRNHRRLNDRSETDGNDGDDVASSSSDSPGGDEVIPGNNTSALSGHDIGELTFDLGEVGNPLAEQVEKDHPNSIHFKRFVEEIPVNAA